MEFIVSYDLIEFEKYYKTFWESIPNREQPNLDKFERDIIIDNPSHLIVWMEGKKIIGHAIWHETYTDRHSEEDPRDDDDRKILEEINTPLVQLIRNAIYHGIESPRDRIKKRKNEIGTLKIKTFRRAGSIFIEVQDDGAGLNYDKIREKVMKKGYYDLIEVEQLANEDLHKFILMPGFSTLSEADIISGRGMGLAIVAEKIKELGGDFTIQSQAGVGTKFTIIVPFTRAILKAQQIQISDDLFAIPTENIKQIYFFNPSQVEYVDGQQFYKINSKLMPIIHLDEYLNMVEKSTTNSHKKIAIWCQGDEDSSAVFIADKQLQQLDVVVKPFKSNYSDSRDILGSTITGEGSICLIIDVLSIISSILNENIISNLNL